MSLTKVTYAMIQGAPVNVLDFGAIGDGTTDDTAAIQAAIDTGNAVFFPSGTYLISDVVNLAGGSLYGNGDATIKRNQTSGNYGTQLLIATSLSNFEIKGLNIEGGYTSGGYINNVTPTDGDSGAGISLISCSNVIISECKISNVWGDCVYIASNSPSYVAPTNITVQDCVLYNPFRGSVTSTHCVGLYVLRNNIYKPIPYVNTGILIEPNFGTVQTVSNLVVSQNTYNGIVGFIAMTTSGVLTNPITNVVVSENNVQSIYIFACTAPSTNGISIVNNTLTNTPLLSRANTFMDMFSIASATNVYISGNKMLQADGSSTAYVAVHLSACTGVTVIGNMWQSKLNPVTPTDTTVGLVNRSYLTVASCNDCVIVDNVFDWRPTGDPNNTAPINFTGTTTDTLTFENNKFVGFYGIGLKVDSSFTTGYLKIKNNSFAYNISTVYPIGIFADNGNIELTENTFTSGRSNNVYLDTGVTQPVLGATELRASAKIGYASAAPTTGTWGQGSTIWNINATSAQPAGWMCVVGGTPGTWKAMANLA